MARVPQAPTSAGGNARGALGADPSAPFRNVSVPDLGAAGGNVLEPLADRIRKDQRARDGVVSAEAEAAFQVDVVKEIQNLDPLGADYDRQVDEVLNRSRESSIETTQFETEQGRSDLAQRLAGRVGATRLLAATTRRDAIRGRALETRRQAADETLSRIRQDPGGFDAYVSEFSGVMERLAPSLDPTERAALAESFGDDAIIAQAEGLATKGSYANARGLLDDHQDQLSPAQFRGAKSRVRQIENEQRQDFLRQTSRTIADFEIGLISDGVTDPAAVERFEAANPGIYEGRQEKRVAHVRMIEATRKARIKAQKDLREATQNALAGRGLDTEKQAEALWNDRLAALGPDADPDVVLEQAAHFAEETGWVPPRMAQDLENAERTDSPDLLAAVATQYDRVVSRAPNAKGLEKAGPRVSLTQAYVTLLGADYRQAAETVLAEAPDQATLTARREAFKTEVSTVDFRDEIEDSVDFDEDEITPQLQQAYETTLALMYDLSGDIDIAREATRRHVEKRFGTSNVGGTSFAMELPPERYFPAVAQNLSADRRTEIVNREVESFLDEFGVAPSIVAGAEARGDGPRRTTARFVPGQGTIQVPVGEEGPDVVDASGIPPYRLVTDRRTRREVARGEPPSYELLVRQPTGNLAPIPAWVDAETGEFLTPEEAKKLPPPRRRIENLRYFMPTNVEVLASPEFAAEAERSAREAEAIRTEREIRQQGGP